MSSLFLFFFCPNRSPQLLIIFLFLLFLEWVGAGDPPSILMSFSFVFCLRFPTFVFFFSLLPFVFTREVGSLHLFVSRRLIFLFLLLYMSQKNPHVVLCIVAKFFCVLVVVSGWVLLIICWWYQCSWLRQTLDRCVLLLVVTWSMVKQAMSHFQQLTNLIQYPWYP